MSCEELMVSIFREVFPDFTLTAGEYGGGSDRYATYETEYSGDHYADDKPQDDRVLFLLTVYAPAADRLRIRLAELRARLEEADFTFPDIERDGDANQQIWLLTFRWEEAMQWPE